MVRRFVSAAAAALLAFAGPATAQQAEKLEPPKTTADAVAQAYLMFCMPMMQPGTPDATGSAAMMGYASDQNAPHGSPFANKAAPLWRAPTPEGRLIAALGSGDARATASCDLALYDTDPAASTAALLSWLECDGCPFVESKALPPAPAGMVTRKFDWTFPGGQTMISVLLIARAAEEPSSAPRLRLAVYRLDAAPPAKTT